MSDTSQGATILGSRTGESVPGWREKVRAGSDASSPFQSDRSRIDGLTGIATSLEAVLPGSPGSVQRHSWSGLNRLIPTSVAHQLPDQATAEADALSKLHRKLNQELSHLAGASSLAEFADVLHQFGHPFQAIIDLTNRRLNRLALEARGLKGSTTFRKVKWAQIVASTWLEYAFGLAPLISDTRKAAEALARFRDDRDLEFLQRSKVVARGQSVKSTQSTSVGALGSTWIYSLNQTRYTTTYKVQYVAGLSHTLLANYGSNERLIQLLGFRPQDWIPAAWEVVPWSWLVDYFTNVGDILQASATSTADVTWCNKTVTKETVYEYQFAVNEAQTKLNMASSAPWVLSKLIPGSSGGFTFVRKTVDRVTGVKPGIPPLVFQLPSQWGQLANMAAVLISRRPSSSALWLT